MKNLVDRVLRMCTLVIIFYDYFNFCRHKNRSGLECALSFASGIKDENLRNRTLSDVILYVIEFTPNPARKERILRFVNGFPDAIRMAWEIRISLQGMIGAADYQKAAEDPGGALKGEINRLVSGSDN